MATMIKSLSAPIAERVLGLLLLAMIAIAYYQVTHDLTTTTAIAGCLVAVLSIRKPMYRFNPLSWTRYPFPMTAEGTFASKCHCPTAKVNISPSWVKATPGKRPCPT